MRLYALVGQLFGKICLTGHTKYLLDSLFPFVIKRIEDESWRTRFVDIIDSMPQSCLQNFIEQMLTRVAETRFPSILGERTWGPPMAEKPLLPNKVSSRVKFLVCLFGEFLFVSEGGDPSYILKESDEERRKVRFGYRGDKRKEMLKNADMIASLLLRRSITVKVYGMHILTVLSEVIEEVSRLIGFSKGRDAITNGRDELESLDEDEEEGEETKQTEASLYDVSLSTRVLFEATELWGDKEFIRHSPYEQQRYVTRFISLGLAKASREQLQQERDERGGGCLLTKLIMGVQAHIECPVVKIRKLGMTVGEQFSVIMDPKNPLKFDPEDTTVDGNYEWKGDANIGEVLEKEETEEMEREKKALEEKARKGDDEANKAPRRIVGFFPPSSKESEAGDSENDNKHKRKDAEKTKQTKVKSKKVKKKKKEEEELDPDALFLAANEASSSEETDGSESDDALLQGEEEVDSDSDDGLVPYDLEDDESDLNPVKLPHYLRDCISVLRNAKTNHEADKWEGALRALEGLIRADDVNEVADVSRGLAAMLLHMENEFALEDFVR